jgi:uncharacterized membrane protein
MNTHKFSFGAMIKSGWHTFKTHWKLIWLAGFATAIIQAILQMIQSSANNDSGEHKLFSILAVIFVFLIGLIIKLGWSKVFLGFVRSHTVTWNTFKTDPNVWLKYIKVMLWYIGYMIMYMIGGAVIGFILIIIGKLAGSQIVTVIGTVLAVIAFIVVAIYFSVKYQFTNYAVLDYPELSSRNVFRKSGALTKGNFWRLFGFAIVLALFNILGLICLVIGLAFTIPTSKIAMTKVYEFLKEKHEHVA